MADDKLAGSLPTELISEKSFYTLGGASAAVFLTCWAINYVAVDVTWMTYKTYRLLAILLSEVFAIIIVYKTRKKSSLTWFFAFLNGILIFVNVSGLNGMTNSYIFNPKDTTYKRGMPYRYPPASGISSDLAGIIPLPRMIDWWPNEGLIKQNNELEQENKKLANENDRLHTQGLNSSESTLGLIRQRDSLISVIGSLTKESSDKQKQIDQLISSRGSEDLQTQLKECNTARSKQNDELTSCRASNAGFTKEIQQLKEALGKCSNDLDKCRKGQGQTTLTELLRQVCEKNATASINIRAIRAGAKMTKDDSLRVQGFYKNVNWSAFCQSFNAWYYPVIIK